MRIHIRISILINLFIFSLLSSTSFFSYYNSIFIILSYLFLRFSVITCLCEFTLIAVTLGISKFILILSHIFNFTLITSLIMTINDSMRGVDFILMVISSCYLLYFLNYDRKLGKNQLQIMT